MDNDFGDEPMTDPLNVSPVKKKKKKKKKKSLSPHKLLDMSQVIYYVFYAKKYVYR